MNINIPVIKACFWLVLFHVPSWTLDFLPQRKGDFTFSGGSFTDTAFEGTPYVTSVLLDSLLGGASDSKPGNMQWKWRDRRGREWIFTEDNPFVSVSGEIFNLIFPPYRVEEQLYIPFYPLQRLFRIRFRSEPILSPESGTNSVYKAAIAPDTGKSAVKKPAADSAPKMKAPPAKPYTVIVDAGHGGHDRGAVIKGSEEAVITLAVAQEFGKALKELGYRVLYTRTEDDFKTLQERPRFASDSGGDLFLSLHCNSLSGSINRLKMVRGFVAYILREGESEEDKALARRENEAVQLESGKSGKSEIAPVDWMLLEHQLNIFSKQSESLTESIVNSFDGFEIPKYSTGARQAGFFVLVGAYMPAVLFEMGFLTQDEDRRILTSKNGQKDIAKRLAKAIDRFKKKA